MARAAAPTMPIRPALTPEVAAALGAAADEELAGAEVAGAVVDEAGLLVVAGADELVVAGALLLVEVTGAELEEAGPETELEGAAEPEDVFPTQEVSEPVRISKGAVLAVRPVLSMSLRPILPGLTFTFHVKEVPV